MTEDDRGRMMALVDDLLEEVQRAQHMSAREQLRQSMSNWGGMIDANLSALVDVVVGGLGFAIATQTTGALAILGWVLFVVSALSLAWSAIGRVL